jgi:hypothetical protein
VCGEVDEDAKNLWDLSIKSVGLTSEEINDSLL